jgi:hypothetical protein
LLQGERFIDAVARARTAAHALDGNTWAAYQCYGDPDWRLLQDGGEWKTATARPDEWNNIVSTSGLKLVLRTMIAQSTFQQYDRKLQRERLRHLRERWVAMKWTTGGGVGDLFAEAHAAAGDVSGAIDWYDVVLASATGDGSIRAFEQRSNLRVRAAWDRVEAARKSVAEVSQRSGTPRGRERPLVQRRRQARRTLAQAIGGARRTIRAEDRSLGSLRTFGETAERASLRGGAMKRLAMVEEVAESLRGQRGAIAAMKKHYQEARELSQRAGSEDVFYPISNIIAAQLALGEPVDKSLFDEARTSLEKKEETGPDFWSMAEHANLALYEAVSGRQLDEQRRRIIAAYADLAERAGSGTRWASVYTTAAFVLSRYSKSTKRQTETAAADAVREYLKKLSAASR